MAISLGILTQHFQVQTQLELDDPAISSTAKSGEDPSAEPDAEPDTEVWDPVVVDNFDTWVGR